MLSILLVMAGSTAFSVFLAYLVRRFRKCREADHNGVLGYFFSLVGAFYSFLLAFVVVNTWGNLKEAQANIYEEASNLPGMYYNASIFPDEHRIPMQRTLLEYADAVIQDEWPAMQQGGVSQEVNALLTDLRGQVLAIKPVDSQQSTIYGAMVQHMGKLASTRRTRLNQAHASIPIPFWVALIGGGVLLLGVGMGFQAPTMWTTLALMTTLALVVSSSLCLAYMMDQPFRGGIHVPPAAFETAIRQMGRSP